MAIAFFPVPQLFAGMQALLQWLAAPRPAPAAATVRAAVQPSAARATMKPMKPLRVVRVLEPSASRAVAGRMVISGRLADVCAELDRLVAQEARGC